MSNLFFTSDQHFNHANIVKYRPYNSLEGMNESLIYNWNRVVGARDTVYCLGDFSWSDARTTGVFLSRLHGKKILIPGNHCRNTVKATGWSEVLGMYQGKLLRYNGDKLYLQHFPCDSLECSSCGVWHLHGHMHSTTPHTGKNRYDVGVDANQYTPVAYESIPFHKYTMSK